MTLEMEYFASRQAERTVIIAVVVFLSALHLTSAPAQPPQPQGVTIQFLGTLIIEFKWQAITGDFDNYLAVYYDARSNEVGSDLIPKTEASFRYRVGTYPNEAAYSFHTVKGTARSITADLTPLPAVVFNIQLPNALPGVRTPNSVSISWANAPNPADNVANYIITLEQPPGNALQQVSVNTVAGASHTFQGLTPAMEYRVRVDARLTDGTPVEINVIADTWTVTYPPSKGILHRTGETTGTLTWTEAQGPFEYYELIITSQGGQPRVIQLPPGTNSYLLNILQPGIIYGYSLKTVTDSQVRRYESDSADLTLVEQAPQSLSPMLQAITDHGMHLTWTASQTQGLQAYRVSVLDTKGWSIIADIPADQTSFTLVGLNPGVNYQLVVDEVVGGVSRYAGSVTGATKLPQNVQLTGSTAHTVTIDWSPTLFQSAQSYLVNVISTDASYTNLIPVPPAAAAADAPYTITNLPAGLSYEVGVDAVNNKERFEVGALTNPVNTSTSIRTQAITTNLIETAWEQIDGATYNLVLTNLGDGTTRRVTISNSQTTGHVFTGLTPGQHYMIGLTAMLNGVSIPGGSVNETTIPLPPTSIQVAPTATNTLVSWSPPPNTLANIYEGYRIGYVQANGQPATQDIPVGQTQFTVPVVDNGQNIFLFSTSAHQVSQRGYPVVNYNVSVDGATPNSLRVNYDRYAGQGYRILLVRSDGSIQEEAIVTDPNTMSHVFNNLQPSSDYTAVVTAIEPDGMSTLLLGSNTGRTSAPPNRSPSPAVIAAICVVVVVVIVAVLLLIIYRLRQRRQNTIASPKPQSTTETQHEMIEYSNDINVADEAPSTDYERAGGDHLVSVQIDTAEVTPTYEDIDLPSWAQAWSIPWDKMIVGKKLLGKGYFGEVTNGVVMIQDKACNAAIKKLKVEASPVDRKNFMDGFQRLTQIGRHPNIVGLLGACQHQDILYVALEYVANGDLRSYLRKARCAEDESQTDLCSSKLMQFAHDVAEGMQHLAAIGVIHRDVAARNILLDDNLVAKISGFGLSHVEDIYVQTSKTRVPTRWLSIESIKKRVYTSQSDVWSFGVLLWEIASLGATPYEGFKTQNLLSRLENGYRMPKPSNCDQEIYDLMLECWQDEPYDRPSFKKLATTLQTLAGNQTDSTYMWLLPMAENYRYMNVCPELDDN